MIVLPAGLSISVKFTYCNQYLSIQLGGRGTARVMFYMCLAKENIVSIIQANLVVNLVFSIWSLASKLWCCWSTSYSLISRLWWFLDFRHIFWWISTGVYSIGWRCVDSGVARFSKRLFFGKEVYLINLENGTLT